MFGKVDGCHYVAFGKNVYRYKEGKMRRTKEYRMEKQKVCGGDVVGMRRSIKEVER